MRLTFPKFRTWHFLVIVVAGLTLFAAIQYSWTSEGSGDALVRRLRSTDAKERTKAANELSSVRPVGRDAITRLTEMLFDADPGVRATAARTLLDISSDGGHLPEDEAAVAPVKAALASALGDRDPVARLAIAHALGFLGTEPQVVVPTLLEFANRSDPKVRGDAIAILGPYFRRSEPAATAIFAATRDAKPSVRRRAVDTLGVAAVFPDVAAEPLLGRITTALVGMSGDADQPVRLAAVTALSRIGQRTSTEDPRLIPFLSDADAQIGLAASQYVAQGRPKKRATEFIPALEQGLKNPDMRIRGTSALALGRFGLLAEATLPSLRALANDPDREVRRVVNESIASMEKELQNFREEALPRAIAGLSDADPNFRVLAAGQIEEFGPKASAAVPSLVVCLSDRQSEVRRAAASALGRLGPGATVAIPDLEKLAESDPDEAVRQAAQSSRTALLQADPGKDPAR